MRHRCLTKFYASRLVYTLWPLVMMFPVVGHRIHNSDVRLLALRLGWIITVKDVIGFGVVFQIKCWRFSFLLLKSAHLYRRRCRFHCLAGPSPSIWICQVGLRANLLGPGLQSCRFVIAVHFAQQRGVVLQTENHIRMIGA